MRFTRAKRARRRSFTLLEVVIALSLTSIALFFLFGYYHQLTVVSLEAEKIQERFSARQRLQTRLMQVFSDFPTGDKQEGFLYTDTTSEGLNLSLIFAFNHGIDSDPLLCGQVKAMLFLARDKKLKLRILPLEGKTEEREEILIEQIDSIAFSFFDLRIDDWKSEWNKDAAAFPSMLKVILTEKTGDKKEDVSYAFFLPSSQLPVEYE